MNTEKMTTIQNMSITIKFDDLTPNKSYGVDEYTHTIFAHGKLNPELTWTPSEDIRVTNIEVRAVGISDGIG